METPTFKTRATDLPGPDAHGMKPASISEAIALHKLGVLSLAELRKIVEKLIPEDDDDTPPLVTTVTCETNFSTDKTNH